jgi:hypothetical protein
MVSAGWRGAANIGSEEQIVEIVGVIALFGFLNRWNNTMATPLEDEPIEYLSRGGWQAGKHRR